MREQYRLDLSRKQISQPGEAARKRLGSSMFMGEVT